MKTATFHLELITPCFAGGASPEKQAEIRVPAIRGQLRWWFRVLGGLASLKGTPVREQECMVFGSTAGESGRASPLIVRIAQRIVSTEPEDADQLGVNMNSPEGYLLFPLRSKKRDGHVVEYKGRALLSTLSRFDLCVVWRGPTAIWPDIEALFAVFGHLGSLGFRSRRAMGALAFAEDAPDLTASLNRFGRPTGILIRGRSAVEGLRPQLLLALQDGSPSVRVQ